MRIALLTEIPAPFRIPLWNALAETKGVELGVLLLREHDPRRSYDLYRDEWTFDSLVLPGRDRLVRGRWLIVNRGVRRELDRSAPELVVVGGWNQPAFFQAARWARRRRAPLVVWVESTARDQRRSRTASELLKRRLLRAAAGVIVPGSAAAEYARRLGAARVTIAPNAADPGLIADVDERRRRRAELRAELGVHGCCFLCVSRLSPEKGVDLLVRAFAGVPGELAVAGDGPQEDEVRRLAPPNVRLLGRLARDELSRWYAAADAFALASRSETWGMAVTEAAAAGLPLVVTDAVGAGYDLVEPGRNGFRVAGGDERALREALLTVAGDEGFRIRAGARSRELAQAGTPGAWADAVARLARELCV